MFVKTDFHIARPVQLMIIEEHMNLHVASMMCFTLHEAPVYIFHGMLLFNNSDLLRLKQPQPQQPCMAIYHADRKI